MSNIDTYFKLKIIFGCIVLVPCLVIFCIALIKAIIQQHRYNKNSKYLKSNGYKYSLKSTPSHYWYRNPRTGSFKDDKELYNIKFKDLKVWVENEELNVSNYSNEE